MEESGRVNGNGDTNGGRLVNITNWLLPCRENQRAQKVFKAAPPMDLQAARNKLMGFGMQLLDSIDPNPDNMVCAGIIHTQGQQVGCLLRLEPNKQAQVSRREGGRVVTWEDCFTGLIMFCFASRFQMFRLTIRSSKEAVTQEVCELLMDQF